MDTPAEDSDSDVEVLDPKLLKYRYRRQELRLITALSKCADNQIPKQWEDFQIFVKNVLKFHLSPRLVRSVWVQLHACYQLANSVSSCSVVEIVDEEEGTEVVKQNDDNFINIGGAIQEKLRDKEWEKLINERSSDYVEISDEEEIKQVVKHENDNFSSNIAEVIHERLKPGDEVEKSSNGQSSCDVEIIDEKDSTQIVKQHYEQINDVGGGIHKRLKSGNREDKLCRQQSSSYLEIIEEDKLIARQRYGHFLNAGGIVHEEFKSDLKREKSSDENSYHYVEISDEEEIEQAVDQHKQLVSIVEVAHEELKPHIKEEKSNNELSCDCIEISDDESKEDTKQHDQVMDTRRVFHEELAPGINREKFKQDLSHDVEITDGKQNTNQSHIESNISTKCDNILMPTLERSFIMPNGSKQNRKRTRCSLPASIKEAEAEALREKLLLDKIIELELPQVIKSFMNRNNIVKNCTKKRRRKSSVNNKKSVNGTPSDVSVSVPEII